MFDRLKARFNDLGFNTCPHCLNKLTLPEVLYICSSCQEQVEAPGRWEQGAAKCKKCNGLATIRRCPRCGKDIPKIALETPNLPFSIVGVSNSGKTNFITVMLHELTRASVLNLALGHQDNHTRLHQNANRSLIYDQGVAPPSTPPGGELPPQIWYIKNLAKRQGQSVPTYTFTIFDGAGENHENDLDPASTVCRYIQSSKAIILTLDPLILQSVRQGGIVDETVRRNSLGGSDGGTKNAEEIVVSIASYIKAARGIRDTQVLDIPVAVVLTKFDTILTHQSLGVNALVKSPGLAFRNGRVDLAALAQIDEELRFWLSNIDEAAVTKALAGNFADFSFFGVSSYGSPPKPGNSLNTIVPHRVLDPILWLFAKAKFVD